MAQRDATYSNSKVGMEQGADRIFVDSDGYMNFNNTDFTGAELCGSIGTTLTVANTSTASTVLSTIDTANSNPALFPSTAQAIRLSCTGTMTNGSARMPSGYAGQVMWIGLVPEATGSTGSVRIFFSGTQGLSGVALLGSTKVVMTGISLQQSAASWAHVTLKCTKPGEWAIVGSEGLVTELPSA